MNTLKINVPKGFEVDKKKSTFEEIVFKPIKKELPKTWETLENIDGYCVDVDCDIVYVDQETKSCHRNIFVTKEQAKASIALAQLSQLREVYRQGWTPDWKDSSDKYIIESYENELKTESYMNWSGAFLSFQSAEIRDEFLKNFRNLIEEASPLLFG